MSGRRHRATPSRQRFGRIDLEGEPDAEGAGGEADHHRDDEHDSDALGIEHQPARKIGLEDQHQRQPDEVADKPHRQRLLHDQADDGPVRRADELERGDRAHLVHGQRIDDQRDDDGRDDDQQHHDQELLLARFLDHELAQQGFLLRLGQRREMFPARERGGDLFDRNVRRYLGDDGVDLVAGLRRSAARRLSAARPAAPARIAALARRAR